MLWLIPHLFPDPRLLEWAQPGLSAPGLYRLLGRGRLAAEPREGTEAALCRALGIARQTDWPLAPASLRAQGREAGSAYWLRADPAHFELMRDRIVLTRIGLPDLSQEETDALATSITGHFGSDLPLASLGPFCGHVRYEQPLELLATPPSLAVGRVLDGILPQGRAAGALRVLTNELQMLLHEHPVNQARAARGALSVDTLWFWGGGVSSTVAGDPPPVYANAAEALALAAYCGAPRRPLPDAFDMLDENGVFLLDGLLPPAHAGDAQGWRCALEKLERDWFAPLAAALFRAGPTGVRLLDPVGGRSLSLRRRDAASFWRRPKTLLSRSC